MYLDENDHVQYSALSGYDLRTHTETFATTFAEALQGPEAIQSLAAIHAAVERYNANPPKWTITTSSTASV
jgi:hypothetical protein